MNEDKKLSVELKKTKGRERENSEIPINKSHALCEIWDKIDEIMYISGKTTGKHWEKKLEDIGIRKAKRETDLGIEDDKLNHLIKNAF